jgi:hypothetical protein
MKQVTGIQRTQIDPKAGPQVDSFFVSAKIGANADGYFGVVQRKIDGDSDVYTVPCQSVDTVTADVTLTAEQNGRTIVIDSADPVIVTLPDAKVGLKYKVIILQADNAHAVSPQAADGIAAKGLTAVVDKDLINSTSAAYDSVEIEAVSSALWHAVVSGTWTKE